MILIQRKLLVGSRVLDVSELVVNGTQCKYKENTVLL